jgi:hypothetical protein
MKPSTKAHEVYDQSRMLIVFGGSQTKCNQFWVRQAPQARQTLIVRVAGR